MDKIGFVKDEKHSFTLAFEQICNFNAVSKVGSYGETIQGLVKLCLVLFENDRIKETSKVAEYIEELFGLKIPEFEITNTVSTLELGGLIKREDDGTYRMSKKALHELSAKIEEEKKLEERVKNDWYAELAQKYSQLDPNELWCALRKYFFDTFRRHGIQSVSLIDPYIETSASYTESLSNILNNAVKYHFETNDVLQAQKAINEFQEDIGINKSRYKYISKLADSAFNFYKLVVEPEASKEARKQLNELVLFLDTNFIFGILGLDDNYQTKISHELISAISKFNLPFRLRYHNATKKEIINTIAFMGRI